MFEKIIICFYSIAEIVAGAPPFRRPVGKVFRLCMALLLLGATARVSNAAIISGAEYGTSLDFISSRGEWQISFPLGYNEADEPVRAVSVLRYSDLENTALSLRARFNLFEALSLQFLFRPEGLGFASGGGQGTDRDLFTVPGDQYLFSESAFANRGRSYSFRVSALAPLTRGGPTGGFSLNGLLGYMKNREDVTMSDGIQTVGDGSEAPFAGTVIAGLNSTYRFDWDSLAAGLNARFDRGRRFSFETSLAFLQNFYSGEGFWNLRTYAAQPYEFAWRNESPNFVHYDAVGRGFSLNLTAGMKISRSGRLSVSYEHLSLRAEDGTDKIFFYHSRYTSPGGDAILDYASFTKDTLSVMYTLAF